MSKLTRYRYKSPSSYKWPLFFLFFYQPSAGLPWPKPFGQRQKKSADKRSGGVHLPCDKSAALYGESAGHVCVSVDGWSISCRSRVFQRWAGENKTRRYALPIKYRGTNPPFNPAPSSTLILSYGATGQEAYTSLE